MTFPRARLVVSAILFLGWITYLFVLAVQTPAIIVSRPQLLVSSLYVEAEIRDDRGHPNPQVKVVKILWPQDDANKKLIDQQIDVPELFSYGKSQGYEGARAYILPLSRLANPAFGEFIVTPIPRLPDIFPTKDRLAIVELQGVPIRPSAIATLAGILAAPIEPIPYWVPSAWIAADQAGDQPVIRCLVENGRQSKEDAAKLVSFLRKLPFGAVTVARGWPITEAWQLRKQLQDAGATARVTEVDVEIYPATPQVLAQIDEIVAMKKK